MRDLFFVECNADLELVFFAGIEKKRLKHAGNKSEVLKSIRKKPNSLGIVDEDPSSAQPSFLSKLQIDHEENGLRILRHPQSGNVVVVICPRLEEWILQCASNSKIDVAQLGLPRNGRDFHSVINLNLARFRHLLDAIGPNNKSIRYLKDTLRA